LDKTNSTNLSDDQHAWPLYFRIGNIQTDIFRTPKNGIWILLSLIACPPKAAKNIDGAWHTTVGTRLTRLIHLNITGPGLKWDCADGFQ
jgi:hypothetical protein